MPPAARRRRSVLLPGNARLQPGSASSASPRKEPGWSLAVPGESRGPVHGEACVDLAQRVERLAARRAVPERVDPERTEVARLRQRGAGHRDRFLEPRIVLA